jgi:Mn2+/Fe2+ NRAMP family transporter
LTGFLPSVGKYFPFSAATAAASPDGAKDVLNPYAGGAIFVAFTVVLLIAGGTLLSARDA